MRLTSLTLHGFKSFGNRTAIEFSPGVTAIVGPNGSGKSNLLDALKWVTGGGRAREFRAEAKTDLIFHGADGKRTMGYAEVEVELADARRSLKIQRDLHRDGGSHLRLDGRSARFLDVDEALAGSGLGTAGVAVIGQGEVAGVLMADPATLLGYVAEAAGVARLAGRREQTLARLDTARLHLARLEDVLLELRERIEHLRHEAEAAARHAELAREALVLRVTAGHARVAAVRGEVEALQRDTAAAEQRVLELREQAAAARRDADAMRRERVGLEAAYRDALAAAAAAQGALDLARAESRRVAERVAALGATRDAADAERRRLESTPEPVAPNEDPEVARSHAARTAAAAAAARDRMDAATTDLAAAETDLEAARARRARAEQAWASYRGRHEGLAFERAEVAREQRDLEEARGSQAVDEAAIATAARRRDAAITASEDADRALEAARRDLEHAHAQHAAAFAEAAALARSVERQRAAFEARRGYAQGPRVALTSGIPGVHGSVADLLRVPADLEAAVAGALGRRAEYVVVDTAETGEAVLATVRGAAGWATVLPLDLVHPPTARGDARWAALPGVVAAAAEVVSVAPAFRAVVELLLAHTYVVTDLAAATALARQHRDRPRLVTLAGDVVESSGAMSGGARGGAASVLGQARDLEDAEAAAEAARHHEATARDALDVARKRVQDAAHAVRSARDVAQGAREAHADLSARDARVAARRADLEQRRQRLDAALAALAEPQERDEPAAVEAAAAVAEAARESVASQRGDWERAATAAADAERAAAVADERWQAYRARLDAHTADLARAAALAAEVAAHDETERAARAELVRAQAAVAAADAALPRDVDARRAAFEALDARLREAEIEARGRTEAQAEAGETWEGLRVALARREAALELALEERAELPVGVLPLDLSERVARARWRETEAALEALGAVNHRAAADHASQAERLAVLEAEAADASEAVDTLAATLEAIDHETTERLGTALEGLREGFAEHVRQLFGPTAVGAIEVEHEGERPVGVRIRLQPPGKRTQSLNLLSVGERSMGALGFLFALMAGEAGGLPIAVLDEVDAPLDEANIRRFCTFVEALSARGTQFVLITHQKATFEVADTLWGVTTEAGVSRVFGIRRDDPRMASVA